MRPTLGVALAFAGCALLAFGTALAGGRAAAAKPKLTIVRDGPGRVANLSGTISCGTQCSAKFTSGTAVWLTASSVDGSRFLGWTGACRGESVHCTLFLNGTATTRARFEPAMVQLDVTVGGAGRVMSDPPGIECGTGSDGCAHVYVKHTVVRLQAAPSPTSAFVGWAGACTGTGVCRPSLSESRSVRAVFRRRYAISATASGPGTVESGLWPGCQPPCSALSRSDAVVPLAAVPAAGAAFDHWEGACAGAAASCVLATDAPSTVTASFVLLKPVLLPGLGSRLEVTVAGPGHVTGGGIACSPTCAARPNVPAVLLTATPLPSAVFAGWGGDCAGVAASTCPVGLGAARTVTATFRRRYSLAVAPPLQKPTVTISPPGTSCVGACSVPERSDALVTISVAPPTDHADWGAACTGRGIVCSLAVDAPVTIPLHVTATLPASFTAYGLVVSLTRKGTVKGGAGFACTRVSGPTTCSDNVRTGTNVQLAVTPKARFLHWSGACTGKKPTCALTMNGTKVVIAHLRKP